MQICRAQFETKARTCTPPHQPSNGLFFFRAAATFRGILVSFMRICLARFETARAQTSADWAIKDSRIPSPPSKRKSPSPLFPKKTSPLKPVLPLLFICASQHRPHQVHSYILIYLTAVTGGSCRSLGTILCFGAPLGSHLPHIPVCLLSAQGDFSVDTKYRYSLRHCVFYVLC